MKAISLLIAISASIAWSAHANNWPAWRGPEGTGVSADKDFPVKWSTKENVRWANPTPVNPSYLQHLFDIE